MKAPRSVCHECGRSGHALLLQGRLGWICEPCLRAWKRRYNPLIEAPAKGSAA